MVVIEGNAMSVLQAEVYEALRALDVPDDKALKAAVALTAALAKVEDETIKRLASRDVEITRDFSKRDADIDTIRKDVQSLKVDSAVMKWMLGIVLTMVTALFLKAFIH